MAASLNLSAVAVGKPGAIRSFALRNGACNGTNRPGAPALLHARHGPRPVLSLPLAGCAMQPGGPQAHCPMLANLMEGRKLGPRQLGARLAVAIAREVSMANFPTHIAIGTVVSGALATVTTAAALVAPENIVAVTLAGVLGSVLPDIDLKDSRPARAMFAGL